MSKVVDDRVVEMRFDNEDFEKNVKTSLGTLDRLKAALKFDTSTKGLEDISKAANKIDMSNLGNSIETVQTKFSALQVVGITALSELTKTAMHVGKSLLGNIIDPLFGGGYSRATKIDQAKFQLQGLKVAWDDIKADIDYGVSGTAYGLDAAATVAAQLVTSGVKFGEAVEMGQGQMQKALRGISGVAAMTNRTYEDIGGIYTDIASLGKMTAMQLNSLSLRGINATATLAQQLGKSEEEIHKMVSKGEIDFNTFASAMDEAFGEHAKDANETFEGALANMRAALSKITADFYSVKRMNLRDIFNSIRPVINNAKDMLIAEDGMMTKLGKVMTYGTKGVVKFFNNLEGAIAPFVDSVSNIFDALLRIADPIHQAFMDIFPISTTENLLEMGNALKDFTEKLKISKETAAGIKATFQGVFSILSLFGTIIKSLLTLLFPFVDGTQGLAQAIFTVTGVLGKLITLGVNWIKQNKIIEKTIGGIKLALEFFIVAIGTAAAYVASFISNLAKSNVVTIILNGLIVALEGLGAIAVTVFGLLGSAFASILPILEMVYGKLRDFVSLGIKEIGKLVEFVRGIIGKLRNGASISDIFVYVITTILSKILELKAKVSEIFNNGIKGAIDKVKNTFSTLGNVIDKITPSFQNFFRELSLGRYTALLFSIAILVILSNLNRMINIFSTAASSINTFFSEMNKLKTFSVKVQQPMILSIAESILILALAVKMLANIENIDQALIALGVITAVIAGLLGALTLIGKLSSWNFSSIGMEKFAVSMAAVTVAILALSMVFKTLEAESISWGKAGYIATLAFVLTGLMYVINKFMTLGKMSGGKALAGGAALLLTALAIKNVMAALEDITALPIEKIKDTLPEIVMLLIGLGVLTAGLGQLGLGAAAGVLVLVAVMKLVGEELTDLLGNIDFTVLFNKLNEYKALIGEIGVVSTGLLAVAGIAGKGFAKFGRGMLLLSGAIAIIGFVIKQLAEIAADNPDGLTRASIVIGGLLVFVAIFEKIATKLRVVKGKSKNAIMSFAASLVVMSVAIGIIAGICAMVASIKDNKVLWKMVVVVAVIGVLVGTLEGLSALTKGANTKVIMSFMIGLVVLFGELAVLSVIPYDQILPAASAMGIVILAFAAAMTQMNKLSLSEGMKSNAGSLIAITLMLGILMGTLYALTKLGKPDEALAVAISMAVAIGVVIGLFNSLGNASKTVDAKVLSRFLPATLMLGAIGASLWAITKNDTDWGRIAAAAGSMVACLMVISGLFESLGNASATMDAKVLSRMIPLVFIIAALGYSLSSIAAQPWDQITAAAGGLSVALIVITGALTTLNKLNADTVNLLSAAGAIMVIALAMIPMAEALNKLGTLDLASVGAMAGIIFEIAVVLGVLAAIGAGTGELFTVTLIAVAGAFLLFAPAMMMLGEAAISFSEALYILLPPLGEFFQLLASLIEGGIASYLPSFAGGLALIGAAGVALLLGAPGLMYFALAIPSIATFLPQIAGLDLSTTAAGLALIGAAGLVLAVAAPGLISAGLAMPILALGITALSGAMTLASTAITEAVNAIVLAFQTLVQAGIDAGTGLANGLVAGASAVGPAAANLANKFFTVFRAVTGWASPWKTLVKAGKDAVVGLKNGLESGDVLGGLSTAATTLGKGVKDAVSEGMGNMKALGAQKAQDLMSGFSGVLDSAGFDFTNFFDIEEIGKDITDQLSESMGDLEGSLGGAGGAAGKAGKDMKSLSDTISEQMDIFSEFNAKTEMSAEQMLNNMRSQIEGVKTWSANIATLATRGIDQGLLKKLGDMGPKSYEYVNAFVNMSSDQLAEANQLFQESLLLPDASEGVITNSYALAGMNAAQGFANGMDAKLGAEAALNMALASLDALNGKAGLDEHSPSKKTFQSGEYAAVGLQKGIEANEHRPINAIIILAKKCMDEFDKVFKLAKFKELGEACLDGLASGLNNAVKVQSVKDAAATIAKEALESAKEALDSHSPSRKFDKLGRDCDTGLINGLKAMSSKVIKTGSEIGNTAFESVKNSISRIASIAMEDIDANPTITPVLDLSNIEEGASRINSMMNSNLNLSGLYNRAQLASGTFEIQKAENFKLQNGGYSAQNNEAALNMMNEMTAKYNKSINRLADVIKNNPNQTKVVLEGDAGKVFNLVTDENSRFVKSNGYSPLYNY